MGQPAMFGPESEVVFNTVFPASCLFTLETHSFCLFMFRYGNTFVETCVKATFFLEKQCMTGQN